jgi:hypothetical protein
MWRCLLGDEVVEHEGSKVLIIAKELAANLQGITMDVQDTPDGPKIVLLESQTNSLR